VQPNTSPIPSTPKWKLLVDEDPENEMMCINTACKKKVKHCLVMLLAGGHNVEKNATVHNWKLAAPKLYWQSTAATNEVNSFIKIIFWQLRYPAYQKCYYIWLDLLYCMYHYSKVNKHQALTPSLAATITENMWLLATQVVFGNLATSYITINCTGIFGRAAFHLQKSMLETVNTCLISCLVECTVFFNLG